MVIIAYDSCLKVSRYAFATRPGRMPSSSAAVSVASRQAVPEALSQLNVNTAPYGDGDGVTGGTRWIMLCNPGTFRPFSVDALIGKDEGRTLFVQVSIAFLMSGSPQAST